MNSWQRSRAHYIQAGFEVTLGVVLGLSVSACSVLLFIKVFL